MSATLSMSDKVTLKHALDAHCMEAEISSSNKFLRGHLATRIMFLYTLGIRDFEGIMASLRADRML